MHAGQRATGADQILLRTERAVYRAGDRIQLRVFSTKERGTAYVDVVKDGQTVLTRDVDLGERPGGAHADRDAGDGGHARSSMRICSARDARPVADHRLVFVQPADELKIEAHGGRAGVQARRRSAHPLPRDQFARRGSAGGAGAAGGGRGGFRAGGKAAGFAKVFFYLEQEVMKPRYEIHSIGMPEVVETGERLRRQRDRAARALFAATEMVSAQQVRNGESGRTVPQAKYRGIYGALPDAASGGGEPLRRTGAAYQRTGAI